MNLFVSIVALFFICSEIYASPFGMKSRRSNLGEMEKTLKQTSESDSSGNTTISESCTLDRRAKDEARKSCPPDDDPEECPADQETIETCCKCFKFCCMNGISAAETRQVQSAAAIIFPEEPVTNAKSTNVTTTTTMADPIYGSTSTQSKEINSTKSTESGRFIRSAKSMKAKKPEELEVSKATVSTKATKGTGNKGDIDDENDTKFKLDEKVIRKTIAEAASALKNATEERNISKKEEPGEESWVTKKELVACSTLKSSGSVSVHPSNIKGVNCTEHNILDEFFPPKSGSSSNSSKRTRRGVENKEIKKNDTSKATTDTPGLASTTESSKSDKSTPNSNKSDKSTPNPNKSKRNKRSSDSDVLNDDYIPEKKSSMTSTTEPSILDQFIPPTMNSSSATGEATKTGRSKRSPGIETASQVTVIEIEQDKQKDSGGVVAVGRIKNETETRSRSFVTSSIEHGTEGVEIQVSPMTDGDAYNDGFQKSSNYRDPGIINSEYDSFHHPVSSTGSLTETFPTVQINTTTINQIKPGRCQSITGGKQCISLGPDASQCSTDGQCDGAKKCCFYGCAPYNRVGICDLPSFY